MFPVQEVREAAYQAWEHAGRPLDDGVRFWLEAEARFGGSAGRTSALDRTLRRLARNDDRDRGTAPELKQAIDEAVAKQARCEFARSFGASPIAAHTLALDGTILWANDAVLTLLGYGRDEYVGRHIARFHADRSVADDILAGLAREQAVHNREARLLCRDESVRHVVINSSGVRKREATGYVHCFITDITERRYADRRRAAEHAVMRTLIECSRFDEARDRLLQAICDNTEWDMGLIWEPNPETGLLRCTGIRRATEIAAFRFERQSREMALPIGVGLPGRVWATSKPHMIGNIATDDNFPRHALALADGLQSAFAFPICNKERLFGVIELLSRELHGTSVDLLQTMAHLGAQIGQSIELSRIEAILHGRERELAVARNIQQSLLPRSHPQVTAFEIAASSSPAQETGGDYFDFLDFSDGSLGIAVGDASGHGVGPALVIAATRAYLRAFAVGESDPSRLLAKVNRCLSSDLDETFVTMFVARLDAANRTLTHASAGHWPAYLIGPTGELKARLTSTTVPLGLEAETCGDVSQVTPFMPNDILLVLTDGIMEAVTPDGELFGIERVLEHVRLHRLNTAECIIKALLAQLETFAKGQFHDDRTIVVIKALPGSNRPPSQCAPATSIDRAVTVP